MKEWIQSIRRRLQQRRDAQALTRCFATPVLQAALLDGLSVTQLEKVLLRSVSRRVAALEPGEALRHLFRLDEALYALQGQAAVAYGGGTHTKHRHMRYHDFFVERVKSGDLVLDVGCGIGAVAHDVAEQAGASVLGIDMSADNIAKARAKYAHDRVEYRVGCAPEDIADRHFDVIILSNVLEHIADRPGLLKRLRESATPDRFLIRVPLFERDWRVPLKKELGVEWRLDPTHETEYTLEQFAGEMESVGLRIVEQQVRWGELWAVVR